MIQKLLLNSVSVLIVSIIIMISIFVLRYVYLPPQIPLFYSLQAGNEQVVDLPYLFILPLSLIVVISINSIVAKTLFKDTELITAITRTTNIFLSILSAYIFIKVILLVTF